MNFNHTINGFLLINKPSGITSFKVIQVLRKLTGVKKIGHAGTLDPLATGLMIIAIGRNYTRQIDTLINLNKTYTGTAIVGISTDTYDTDCSSTIETDVPETFNLDSILAHKEDFLGQINQTPPVFSAKKVKGKRSYELARKGEAVELEPKPVTIYHFDCNNFKSGKNPEFDFSVECSKGTYVRSIIHDLGQKCGVGAHIKALHRTKIADISVTDALDLDTLTIDSIHDNLYAAL